MATMNEAKLIVMFVFSWLLLEDSLCILYVINNYKDSYTNINDIINISISININI